MKMFQLGNKITFLFEETGSSDSDSESQLTDLK